MIDGNATSANELPMTLGFTFYPGVDDIASARAIDLSPGADLDSVNLTLSPRPPTHRIRGRVIDSRTGQPPAKARVVASARTPGVTSNSVLDQMALQLPTNNYNSENGTFEVRDLLPGAYVVSALVQDPVAGAYPQQPTTSGGLTAVAVGDSDVEGVVVTVVPAGPVAGRIRVDGQQQSVTPDRLRLQLSLSKFGSAVIGIIDSRSGPFCPQLPPRTFTFRFANVSVGDYRVTVQGQGAVAAGARPGSNAVYIKEARFDGADVLNGPLRISGTASGTLDILIGVGGGQISGTLTDRRSQPVPVTQVVLIPDRSRDRTELYRTVNTDENGRFNFIGITPGDYKVFSWEGLEPYGWFDPDVMAQSEGKGVSVRVTDSSSEMIDCEAHYTGRLRNDASGRRNRFAFADPSGCSACIHFRCGRPERHQRTAVECPRVAGKNGCGPGSVWPDGCRRPSALRCDASVRFARSNRRGNCRGSRQWRIASGGRGRGEGLRDAAARGD